MQIDDLIRATTRVGLIALEIAILTALVLATRFANYQDVFVGGNVYFTDADCYARMTRVRMCAQHPGLIVRHHSFENFPEGTNPHTTAPLDYLIVGLSILLRPFNANAIDLAGALISPLFALFGGIFLWWWSRRMKLRFRWALLILYAISPILVHGTELGRPDHQSLSILLVTIAICAEWTLRTEPSMQWSVISGTAWSLAIWVSAYEPLILMLLLLACHAVASRWRVPGLAQDRHLLFGKHRRAGWIAFAAIIALAMIIERRIPSLSVLQASDLFQNWSRTIGELAHVWPANPIWFRWVGWLLIAAPFLIWFGISKKTSPPIFLIVLLVGTYVLTIWQTRWAYFFLSIFVIAIPLLLQPIKWRSAVWAVFFLSIFPILRDWDQRIWPVETELARRIESRNEAVALRELSVGLMSAELHPFLAPWWQSPSIAYWSGQAGVAGSSHESLPGIADSARFFLATNIQDAQKILERRRVAWVIAYDAERVARNSAQILGVSVTERPLCQVLDQTAGQAPAFLRLVGQNGVNKVFAVANNR